MGRLWTLWRRELGAYFHAPMAYVVMVYFLLMMGFSYLWVVDMLKGGAPGSNVVQRMFASGFFWIAVMMIIPVITMRLFTEERKEGTIETLMTAPVTAAQLVWSKFLGALTFYVILWLPTLAHIAIIYSLLGDTATLDGRVIASAYLGTFLLGMMFIAIGLFFSSFSTNQIVAAVASFAAISVFFFFGFVPYVTSNEVLQRSLMYVSGIRHMEDFSNGIISTKPVVFYMSTTFLVLYVTSRLLETRNWR